MPKKPKAANLKNDLQGCKKNLACQQAFEDAFVADGGKVFVQPDGGKVFTDPDGGKVFVQPDGTVT
jgi:hypothetical protein